MTDPANLKGTSNSMIKIFILYIIASIGNYKGVMLCTRPGEDVKP
jgi:hypothetical protein